MKKSIVCFCLAIAAAAGSAFTGNLPGALALGLLAAALAQLAASSLHHTQTQPIGLVLMLVAFLVGFSGAVLFVPGILGLAAGFYLGGTGWRGR